MVNSGSKGLKACVFTSHTKFEGKVSVLALVSVFIDIVHIKSFPTTWTSRQRCTSSSAWKNKFYNSVNIARESSPTFFRINLMILYSAEYIDNTVHSIPFHSLEQSICTTPNDKNPTRPEFEPSTSEFQDTAGPNEPLEPACHLRTWAHIKPTHLFLTVW